MALALLFPGQGSQSVGMGAQLAEAFRPARDLFEEVDEALSQNLFRLMTEGPDSDLTRTENAQPALMAVSMAVIRVLEREAGFRLGQKARFVAGHSLGEYTALAAAGTFGVADVARLLKRRGQAMQDAVPVGEGAMAALLGIDLETALQVAATAGESRDIGVANDNAPGQVVISGRKEAVERAVAIAAERGCRKAVMLPVSAPFHCALMASAADAMAEALAGINLLKPQVPLVANVTADATSDPAEIRKLLVQQVTGMVRWRESVSFMAANEIDRTVEIGAGKVLSGLVRRISKEMRTESVGTPAELDALVASL